MYDVIVIGTGPSGSAIANKLADYGLKTLMIDKYKLPRHKSCSGVLITYEKTMGVFAPDVAVFLGKAWSGYAIRRLI